MSRPTFRETIVSAWKQTTDKAASSPEEADKTMNLVNVLATISEVQLDKERAELEQSLAIARTAFNERTQLVNELRAQVVDLRGANVALTQIIDKLVDQKK